MNVIINWIEHNAIGNRSLWVRHFIFIWNFRFWMSLKERIWFNRKMCFGKSAINWFKLDYVQLFTSNAKQINKFERFEGKTKQYADHFDIANNAIFVWQSKWADVNTLIIFYWILNLNSTKIRRSFWSNILNANLFASLNVFRFELFYNSLFLCTHFLFRSHFISSYNLNIKCMNMKKKKERGSLFIYVIPDFYVCFMQKKIRFIGWM